MHFGSFRSPSSVFASLVFTIVAPLSSGGAWASTSVYRLSNTQVLSSPAPASKTESKTESKQHDFSLGVSSTNYLGQGTEERARSFSSLDFQFAGQSHDTALDSRLEAQGSIGLNDSNFMFFEVPQGYLGTAPEMTGDFALTLGRKIETWNTMDSTWVLGAWNPRFRWDYLRPQEVGMIGASVSYQSSMVRAVVFGSPIFIPDRGAPLDFADGRVRSISPWVLNPPSKVEIANGKVADIRYKAEIPDTKDVILNPSFSSLIRVGEKRGLWASAGYAYKPMNSLLISYEAGHNNATLDVDAILYPRVAYHHLASFDVGHQSKKTSFAMSFLADLPKDEQPNLDHRTSQVVDRAYIVSPTFQWAFASLENKKGGSFSLSYLKKFGTEPEDVGEDADGTASFDSRYPYASAFLSRLTLPTWRRFTVETSLLLDIDKLGTISSWNFNYEAQPRWNVFVSADVLTSWSNDLSSFIYRYRANDRFMGGVSYVF